MGLSLKKEGITEDIIINKKITELLISEYVD